MVKIPLTFSDVAEIVGSDTMSLLTLTDAARENQLTIVCDRAVAQQLGLRARGMPAARLLLPEVMGTVARQWGGLQLELIIVGLDNGVYKTLLVNTDTMDVMPIRASDAVLLSVAAGIPLYIEEHLMKRQSVPFQGGGPGINIPVNTLSLDMLENALAKAVDEENYETASKLRDEIERRRK
ncbi:MAG: bifunctional nuclease family protein [Prevotella sp.]|nr:bifunctional nuclease family protein [Prevotella sp.]